MLSCKQSIGPAAVRVCHRRTRQAAVHLPVPLSEDRTLPAARSPQRSPAPDGHLDGPQTDPLLKELLNAFPAGVRDAQPALHKQS
jgi:hypothetical protein